MRTRLAIASLLVAASMLSCGSGKEGVLVTLTICPRSSDGPQTLTIRTTDRKFVEEANRLLATGRTRVAMFDLLDGPGPDPQWSWHVDPSTPVFADAAIELCDGCPREVEANKQYWLQTVKRYCPWAPVVSSVGSP